MRFDTLGQLPLYTDDFAFTESEDIHIKDTIVIANPWNSIAHSKAVFRSTKTLEEQIQHVRENQIKKALIIGEDISFLRQCPTLETLSIYPACTAETFDYSPLYSMPNIRSLFCETMFGIDQDKTASVDYSRIKGLEQLTIRGRKGHLNIGQVMGLRELYASEGQPVTGDLGGFYDKNTLEVLSLCQSPVKTLAGLNGSKKLRSLSLSYCKRLTDISGLRYVQDTLQELEIEACSKIENFQVLAEMRNLKKLTLWGNNTLPDVSFLANMPNLEEFYLTMNVFNGDLSLCAQIPYVRVRKRRHFTHLNNLHT